MMKKSKLQYIGVVLGILGVCILLLPRPFGESVRLERVFSIESRRVDIVNGFSIIQKSPIIGIGHNRIRAEKQLAGHSGGGISSSYMVILVTSGILGLLSFIYLIFRSWQNINWQQRLIFLPVLVGSLFDNIILVNYVFFVMILIISKLGIKDKTIIIKNTVGSASK